MTDVQRDLLVDGLVNARDLGGLPLIVGGFTPLGVFFRSENVDAITEKGWDDLHEAGVRTIVDLRQPAERARDTTRRPQWLTTTHVDLDGVENSEFWKDYWDNGLACTALYFLPHLGAMPERTGAVLSALAQPDQGGVLFHCLSGRDRTGMIAMVLLAIAGVEPESIVEDYLETVRRGDALAAAMNRANPEPQIDELLARHSTTTEQSFRDALAGLDLPTLLSAANVPSGTVRTLSTWRAPGAIR